MRFKLTQVNLIIISLAIFLITNILLWSSAWRRINTYQSNILEIENGQAQNRLKDAETRFLNLYEISKKNITMIRNMVEFEMMNNDEMPLISRKLAKFVELDDYYFQARIIDMAGNELVKVENTDNQVTITPPEKLQNKQDRYYFREAVNVGRNDVYVSELDLNEENGLIEMPYRPTLRFFSPLYTSNKRAGVIGLNLNIQNWFDTFKGQNIGLLNGDNQIFYDEQKKLYTSFEEDLDARGNYDQPLYYYKKLSLEGNQFWTIYTRSETDEIETKLSNFKKAAYRTALLVSAFVLFLLIITYALNNKNAKITRLNQNIASQLKERDTLIKEIHHRVKNNLQVVASLLSLQSSFITDENIKMLFRYSQYRINSMGMVHEMLYKSGDLSKIDYEAYIKELVTALIQSMKGSGSDIKLVTEINNVHLNLDTSIPLGLIINEIITNSLKYGFKGQEKGTIFIKLEKLNSSNYNYQLIVSDDGIGFPDKINFRNTKSLGLKLIHKLVLQLRGNIEKDNTKKGTYYIISFKEIEQIS
ncbi:sensor histidine kinase [Euzebyella marina]|uniref:histidine kinase n=1 Tax=Euzebyella marina TaxID=1761453 RepID=A0A3G2L3X8_9FLAO|nr:sensor histidine kinase [Euzebyella marina]AYN66974.1 sensor histidine kinase [Euzebyella marina]